LSVGDGTEKERAGTEGAEAGGTEAWGVIIRSTEVGLNAGGFIFFAVESIKTDAKPTVTSGNPMPKSALPGKLERDEATSVPRDPVVNDLVFKTNFGEMTRRTRLV
jgi:hypothetical protein